MIKGISKETKNNSSQNYIFIAFRQFEKLDKPSQSQFIKKKKKSKCNYLWKNKQEIDICVLEIRDFFMETFFLFTLHSIDTFLNSLKCFTFFKIFIFYLNCNNGIRHIFSSLKKTCIFFLISLLHYFFKALWLSFVHLFPKNLFF